MVDAFGHNPCPLRTDAVELDGGDSSTLWAAGTIRNSPSDGKPRAIANALILFTRPGAGP